MARLADEELGLEQLLEARATQQRSQDTEEPLPVVADEAAGEQKQEEARSVQCECCGMAEDCTPTYISRVRECFHGRWVCGLCAEAVSERQRREPALTVGEAVESHASLCSRFNSTVRLNPTLALARTMRDIARINSLNRRSPPSVRATAPAARGGASKIGRDAGSGDAQCPTFDRQLTKQASSKAVLDRRSAPIRMD